MSNVGVYQPPQAPVGEAALGPLVGTGSFKPGQCLAEAWSATWSNLGPWAGLFAAGLGAVVLLTLAATLAAGGGAARAAVPLIALGAVLLYLVVMPVMAWGTARFGLNALDGRASFGDLFEGVRRIGTAWPRMVGLTFLMLLIGLPGNLPQLVMREGASLGWTSIAFAVSLAWGLLVSARVYLALFFIVEAGQGVTEAIGSSWRATSGHIGASVAMVLLSGMLSMLGIVAFLIGIVPASLMVLLLWGSAYRQVHGRPALAAGQG